MKDPLHAPNWLTIILLAILIIFLLSLTILSSFVTTVAMPVYQTTPTMPIPPTATPTPPCNIDADVYEPDSNNTGARPITPNGPAQTHNFHTAGDSDWVKFNAAIGKAYTITTSNLGSRTDTILFLFDTDGTTLIAFNDDYIEGSLASQIVWQATLNGTYYVTVASLNPNAFGCNTNYDLSINAPNQVYLPLILK